MVSFTEIRQHAARIPFVLVVTVLAVVTSDRPLAHAGGAERYCDALNREHIELWSSIPAGGVPWYVGVQSDSVAPGFPAYSTFAALPWESQPGVQSMVRAARAWTDVPLPRPPSPSSGLVAPPAASTFRIGSGPAGICDSSSASPCAHIALNGKNVVSLWQAPAMFGGPLVLGRAAVTVMPATGDILEADIALNALSTVGATNPKPAWSFVEYNDAQNRWYASSTWTPSPSTTPPDPELGYASMAAVVVHELGHLAGLGHSLVDSKQIHGDTDTPIMFPAGGAEPFNESLDIACPSCPGGYKRYTANGAATRYGGIIGRIAPSLTLDDVAAIASAYPTPAFLTQLGTIAGTVYLDTAWNTLSGAHVVAVRADSPDAFRVGTLSYADGKYRLPGLPVGDYYILVEPVDQDPTGNENPGYYFYNSDVPNYVWLGSSGCVGTTSFVTELYDSGESFSETSVAKGTAVRVTGGVVAGVDLNVVSGTDMLTIKRVDSSITHYSPRGVVVTPRVATGIPVYPSVEFLVRAPAHASRPVFLLLTARRENALLPGAELLQLPLAADTVVLSAVLDTNGTASFVVPTSSAFGFLNIFAQAAILADGAMPLSGALNLWMASP